MTIFTFSIHATENNIPIININPPIIPTIDPTIDHTSIELPEIPNDINMDILQDRFILDVMKDGDASDIHIDDYNVYQNFSAMAHYKLLAPSKNYKAGLKKIEADIEINIGKGIDFPGLIKASSYQTSGTKGTQIMKTKEILFESGANEQSVCNIDKEFYKAERICTPAAALDSASKGAKCVRYFPPQLPPQTPAQAPAAEAPPAAAAAPAAAPAVASTLLPIAPPPPAPAAAEASTLSPLAPPQPMQVEPLQQSATQITVVFDNKFCQRFGFPSGFTWSATNIPNTTDKFNVTFKCDAIAEVSGEVKWGDKYNKAPFNVLGNKEKNKSINKLMKELGEQYDATSATSQEKLKKIFQLLLMKELGDVMQVFMFYAYVMIKRYETRPPPSDIGAHLCAPIPIEENAMLTVDSVVYLLCRILGLPCVYTGARAGVQSGQAFYKLFTPIVMKNEDVKQHIIQSLENMKTIINDNNVENIDQLTQILIGLTKERGKTNNLKWHFFFLKYPSTATPAATSLAATATPNAKQKWIEVTMSAFARYTGDLSKYNVSGEIIDSIVKNIEKIIADISKNNSNLNNKYEELLQQYNNSSSNLQTVTHSVIQTALVTDTGSTEWYNWDTKTKNNPQPGDIPLQRQFINNKLKEIGDLKQYRSKDYVTKVTKQTYIVNYASNILCDNINTPYKVRSQGYDISKDTIIDITREVDDSLTSIVDAIMEKHKIHSMEQNTNAGVIADVNMEANPAKRPQESDPEVDAKVGRLDEGTQQDEEPMRLPTHINDMGSVPENLLKTFEAASKEGSTSENSMDTGGPSSASEVASSAASSASEDASSASEDAMVTGSVSANPLNKLENKLDKANEQGSASEDAMVTDSVSATIPYYDNIDNYLDLYNIDENINLLSTFLYNMKTYNVDIEIEFDEETEIEFYKEFDKETETEIPKGEGPIEIRRENAIRAILINAIRGILINEYYLSQETTNYNKLFKILTMLGDAPISKFIKEPTYPEFNNACTEYKKDKKDDEDTLYININDDTYEWKKSSQAPLTSSPPLPSAIIKGQAITRKKDNRNKKNKQSKKKKRVKNKRSRKITQRNKIKYNNTNTKQRSARRAKRRASKTQTAKNHKQNIVLKNLSN